MNNGYSILTRRIKGIDIHVWLSCLIIIIISGAILITKIAKSVDCKNFSFSVIDFTGSKGNSFYVNENITFKASTPGNVEWDFGDGFHAKGPSVKHRFLGYGKQNITAIFDGKCNESIVLNIQKNITAPEPDDVDINPIRGPIATTTGKKVTYMYVGKRKATYFEWTIVNSRIQPLQHSNKASYVFDVDGTQIVELQLDHDASKTYQKTVVISPAHEVPRPKYIYQAPPSSPRGGGGGGGGRVQERPQIDTPAKKANQVAAMPAAIPDAPKRSATVVSDEFFQHMFEGVVTGDKSAQSFTNYLCDGINTRVIANGKEETVSSICALLFKSKYKIESVASARDNKNCVSVLRVVYKKKFLGL